MVYSSTECIKTRDWDDSFWRKEEADSYERADAVRVSDVKKLNESDKEEMLDGDTRENNVTEGRNLTMEDDDDDDADPPSVEYQRFYWDSLKKSIDDLINNVSVTNIKNIIPELFKLNLLRGRGLFCESVLKSQLNSPESTTQVLAALVSVINTKFLQVGNLLLRRIVLQLQTAFKLNDKPLLTASSNFIAHLVNQRMVPDEIAFELLTLLLQNPTADSVEAAVAFVTQCGSMLQVVDVFSLNSQYYCHYA